MRTVDPADLITQTITDVRFHDDKIILLVEGGLCILTGPATSVSRLPLEVQVELGWIAEDQLAAKKAEDEAIRAAYIKLQRGALYRELKAEFELKAESEVRK